MKKSILLLSTVFLLLLSCTKSEDNDIDNKPLETDQEIIQRFKEKYNVELKTLSKDEIDNAIYIPFEVLEDILQNPFSEELIINNVDTESRSGTASFFLSSNMLVCFSLNSILDYRIQNYFDFEFKFNTNAYSLSNIATMSISTIKYGKSGTSQTAVPTYTNMKSFNKSTWNYQMDWEIAFGMNIYTTSISGSPLNLTGEVKASFKLNNYNSTINPSLSIKLSYSF